MGSLAITESQDTRLPSQFERQNPTQGNVPNHCHGAVGIYIFLEQWKGWLLLALQHHQWVFNLFEAGVNRLHFQDWEVTIVHVLPWFQSPFSFLRHEAS